MLNKTIGPPGRGEYQPLPKCPGPAQQSLRSGRIGYPRRNQYPARTKWPGRPATWTHRQRSKLWKNPPTRSFTGHLKIISLSWNEPPRDKTNKVSVRPAKTQISLGIRPIWSESSLSSWRTLGTLATHWAHRLIWVFAGRTTTLLVCNDTSTTEVRLSTKTKNWKLTTMADSLYEWQVCKIRNFSTLETFRPKHIYVMFSNKWFYVYFFDKCKVPPCFLKEKQID